MIEFAPGMRTIIRDEELKGLQQIGPLSEMLWAFSFFKNIFPCACGNIPRGAVHLKHGIGEGCFSGFRKNQDNIIATKTPDIWPTYSPKAPNFPAWWEAHKAEWEQ